ncbi:MAG: SIMPL domain-containing protein [Firmicutes bacterium]|nr:SIMPL domain-containing protein [Bacillota bacterium]
MRTIRVIGKGQIKVKPDMTRITLSLEGIYPEYGEALRSSAEDTERLRDLLTGFGFARTDLKTLNFSVDTEYESYQERGVYKQRFLGYKFQHRMKVEFLSDNDRLGKILYALANSPVKPEFRLSYTVKEPEAAKNRLLGKAVADAREKAAALTQAAGVLLKDIQSIDYSWGQIHFEVQPMNRMLLSEECCKAQAGSYDMDIEPEDIEVSDTVTVVWEIG